MMVRSEFIWLPERLLDLERSRLTLTRLFTSSQLFRMSAVFKAGLTLSFYLTCTASHSYMERGIGKQSLRAHTS